jgi:N-alpha-acetyltransferase 15/16, NatA auxiliary subunit
MYFNLARLLLKAEKFSLAEVEYLKLLDDNADNIDHLNGLESSRKLGGQLDSDKRERLFRMYANLAIKYHHSHLIQMKPLHLLLGENFKELVVPFLIKMFRKGLPSLFNSCKGLLSHPEKANIVQETVEDFYRKVSSGLPLSSDQDKEFPTTHLWITYFLAQLYDYQNNTTKALEFIEMAIIHSPAVVELYLFKARIYKHVGDYETAMTVIDYARNLDLQDRFVNSKCTKYMLRNNKLSEAEATIALFTKDNAPVDPNQDLIDMQCIWYAYATALSHQRNNRFGMALKRFNQIEKHFNEFSDDQIDFHTYAVRKQTIRSYIDLIHTFSHIKSHKFFTNSAKGCIETHLTIFEGGSAAEQMIDGVSLLGMSDTERKKVTKKAKKAESKKSVGTESEPIEKTKDLDIFGAKLVVGVDHLAEATRVLKSLQLVIPNDLETLELACRIYLNKGLLLLM